MTALDIKWNAVGIGVISGLINVLSLASPLFMLQVYDRVLTSGSIPTLLGLVVLVAGLYSFQLVFDIIRARILLRMAEKLEDQLSGHLHDAVVRSALVTRPSEDDLQPLRDLDNVRAFLSGNGLPAFFDLPWVPFYLGLCFVFHFWIGVIALAGSAVLLLLTVLAHFLSEAPARTAALHNASRYSKMEAARRNAEAVQAMGLEKRLRMRWQESQQEFVAAGRVAGDIVAALNSTSRSTRTMLQSAILGVGAYLVIEGEVTAGVMIASSIMMGRALAPVDLAIANWKSFIMARQSWARLDRLFVAVPAPPQVLPLPAPTEGIVAEDIVVVPPGKSRPTVIGVRFPLKAGSALGIIGHSGSGKSTVARVLAGAWKPVSGSVRIDGAQLQQWDSGALGRHVGYLPQNVDLFSGTVAENIARFDDQSDAADIVAAAKAAGAHELILRLENGYETQIGESGSALSAGQRQRVGLARALYQEPFLVILDEPNANLDAEGEAAVVKAITNIRRRNGIAVVVAHRPSAVAVVDFVLFMDEGRQRAFGPRDAVLARVLEDQRAGEDKATAGAAVPLSAIAQRTRPSQS